MEDEQQQSKAVKAETIFQKVEWFKQVAFYPAIPAMLLIRRNVGYRTVTPNTMLVVTLIIVIGLLFLPNQTSHAPTVIFGFLLFVYYHVMRFVRWRELRRGTSWHTRSVGVSWLESIPWPQPLQLLNNERRIYRFLDPLACFLVGCLACLISWGIAWCILVSALFLMIWEIGHYERQINRILDIHDELIDAEVQKKVAEHFTKDADAPALPLDRTAGLPTGLARDIASKVEERKRRAAEERAVATATLVVQVNSEAVV